VQAHAAETSAKVAYSAKLHKFYQLQIKESLAYSLYAFFNNFSPYAVMAVTLYYGGSLVFSGAGYFRHST
jgi:ABC transporter transmembrane region